MRAPSVAVAAGLLAGVASACTNGPRPAECDYLSPAIFQPSCATQSCHSRSAAVAGLDFSDADRGYESLTALWVWVPNPTPLDLMTLSCGQVSGEEVCEQRERPLVTPFDPNASRLVNMLRARDASRMPPDRPLPEADIELVEQWILNGARRHPGDGGAADGHARDGALHDGGPRDGGPHDGGPHDGGPHDGGLHDASPHDGAPADGHAADGSAHLLTDGASRS